MDNSSSSPEHDEKTGSFAPRTMGAENSNDTNKKKRPNRRLILSIAVLLLIVAVAAYVFWILPQKMLSQTAVHPSPTFFAAVNALNEEEVNNGQGAAAEPQIEKRTTAEREIRAALVKFPDIQGILSPCTLTGHDVHVVDPSGRILTHFMTDEELPALYMNAREVFFALPGEEEHIILVRGNKLQAYTVEGDPL